MSEKHSGRLGKFALPAAVAAIPIVGVTCGGIGAVGGGFGGAALGVITGVGAEEGLEYYDDSVRAACNEAAVSNSQTFPEEWLLVSECLAESDPALAAEMKTFAVNLSVALANAGSCQTQLDSCQNDLSIIGYGLTGCIEQNTEMATAVTKAATVMFGNADLNGKADYLFK